MRFRILSDLHLEFGEVSLPRVECDCVILAGDVSTKRNGIRWILKTFPDVPVVYVCGNHEFYGARFPRLIEKLREDARGTNVHFLENDFVTIGGFHLFGCTLWTDLALLEDWRKGAAEAAERMNDYKRIRDSDRGYKRLTPVETRRAHLASLEAMRLFLESHDPSRCVIVTHHAPSLRSLPEHRQKETVSCAYASHLDEFILRYQPRLWVHGHIHHNNDYMVGGARVIANPRAYPDEMNQSFISDLVVELPEESNKEFHSQ